ncbi:precorrin-8X methylmutase [Leptolyngbyaceae cyanobacterium UHCC 1019]
MMPPLTIKELTNAVGSDITFRRVRHYHPLGLMPQPEGIFQPALVMGMPIGFSHAPAAKRQLMQSGIVAESRYEIRRGKHKGLPLSQQG